MREKIGRLECLKRNGENERNVIVLLHGFGANAADLFPLADLLDPSGDWTVVCPNAPHEVPIGPGWTGRGWFPISIRDMESGVDFTKVRPPGLDAAAEMVDELIFELNPERLILGGFSQGAMVATEVSFRSPEAVSGLVIWSGSLLDEPNWTKRASALKGKPFLQSHGGADQILPFTVGQRLYDVLKAAGAEGPLIHFGGGHDIPMNVIQQTAKFIAGQGQA